MFRYEDFLEVILFGNLWIGNITNLPIAFYDQEDPQFLKNGLAY